jgi:NADH:ubiquinone oxidoreductase 20 kD subunit and related Fe-S oxidoreductases
MHPVSFQRKNRRNIEKKKKKKVTEKGEKELRLKFSHNRGSHIKKNFKFLLIFMREKSLLKCRSITHINGKKLMSSKILFIFNRKRKRKINILNTYFHQKLKTNHISEACRWALAGRPFRTCGGPDLPGGIKTGGADHCARFGGTGKCWWAGRCTSCCGIELPALRTSRWPLCTRASWPVGARKKDLISQQKKDLISQQKKDLISQRILVIHRESQMRNPMIFKSRTAWAVSSSVDTTFSYIA